MEQQAILPTPSPASEQFLNSILVILIYYFNIWKFFIHFKTREICIFFHSDNKNCITPKIMNSYSLSHIYIIYLFTFWIPPTSTMQFLLNLLKGVLNIFFSYLPRKSWNHRPCPKYMCIYFSIYFYFMASPWAFRRDGKKR
jgi:hypothetical protein